MYLKGLGLADMVSYCAVGDHDLHGGHAALAAYFGHELLGNHAFKHIRQLSPDLLLLVGWKNVDNPINGVRRPDCMQG